MENTHRNYSFSEEASQRKNSLVIPYYVGNKIQKKVSNYTESIQIVNLNTRNLPGIPTVVSGKVYTKDKQPVSNAKIEIWHADDAGAYHTDRNFYFPRQTTLSGCILTNAAGEYKIRTIRPGIYGYRARHFHYKISAEGHTTLETQIYFKNDPRILIDEIAIVAEDSRVIDFKYSNTGYLEGIVNIFLPEI
ncbi:dioxygenase family protein [Aquimarina sp. 2201CG14-23]|uniref:dioxygenase family protein n=1 Tax=Aquimarina mycalae TaxID=3040073 RepID=UPI00247814C2|nr:hypothetical protein [Aquimarina sp. 2201CG14-23]MDH7446198.1 hypothetical protein [Aquimarina sp. 2201CG14-23]